MNQSGSYSVSKKELENADNQYFLLSESSKSGITVTPKSITRTGSGGANLVERQPFLDRRSVEPVRLTPAWEDNNLSDDELNFKNLRVNVNNMEEIPPKDKHKFIFLIFLLYGIGVLMPWNMFINARAYFVDYKLSKEYTGIETSYATYFLSYVGFAAQIPNLIFNWLNIFVTLGGDMSKRIIVSLLIEILMFMCTIVLAMVDSSEWPATFFWATMLTVVILNMASGIFQNTVYGMAAKLPPQYSGALILGAVSVIELIKNISGVFVSAIDIISVLAVSSQRTAAIYYFITALIVLLACFDGFFALPLIKYYRYHEELFQINLEKKREENLGVKEKPSYWKIFKQAFPQLFNIFYVFFITISAFPDMMSGIKKSDPNFFISDLFYVRILIFLTFNVTAMLGTLISQFVRWPKPKYVVIPVVLRTFFVPFFFFCNFHPANSERHIPVLINNDFVFWVVAVVFGLSSGYFSSLALMYNSMVVEPAYAQTAGMFGGAILITGIFVGVMMALTFPIIIQTV